MLGFRRVPPADFSADRIKHLEFIQATIARQAAHSFSVKGWSLTVAAALFASQLSQYQATGRAVVGIKTSAQPWAVKLSPWLDSTRCPSAPIGSQSSTVTPARSANGPGKGDEW